MAGDGRLDGWTWVVNPRNGGSTFDPDGFGYPWRLVLHEIQGDDRVDMIRTHKYPPHLWYDPVSRDRHQTVPLTRGAFALEQPSAPHYTNRARAIQVELAGFTETEPVESDEVLWNIARDVVVPIVEWVRAQGGDINLADVPAPGVMAMSARVDAPQRMSWDRWARFGGVCSHRHVPGNSHWDTGALRVDVICQRAAGLLGGSLGPAGVEDELTNEDKAWIEALFEARLRDVVHSVTGAVDLGVNAEVQHPGFPTVRSQFGGYWAALDARLAALEAAVGKLGGAAQVDTGAVVAAARQDIAARLVDRG